MGRQRAAQVDASTIGRVLADEEDSRSSLDRDQATKLLVDLHERLSVVKAKAVSALHAIDGVPGGFAAESDATLALSALGRYAPHEDAIVHMDEEAGHVAVLHAKVRAFDDVLGSVSREIGAHYPEGATALDALRSAYESLFREIPAAPGATDSMLGSPSLMHAPSLPSLARLPSSAVGEPPIAVARGARYCSTLVRAVRTAAGDVATRLSPTVTLWARGYKTSMLKRDLVAGVTIGLFHLPQGLAYATLAGLPLEYGLYAGMAPAIVYATFGTSRQGTIGPQSIVSLLISAAMATQPVASPADYVRQVPVRADVCCIGDRAGTIKWLKLDLI